MRWYGTTDPPLRCQSNGTSSAITGLVLKLFKLPLLILSVSLPVVPRNLHNTARNGGAFPLGDPRQGNKDIDAHQLWRKTFRKNQVA